MTKIVLVEDDLEMQKLICEYLDNYGYQVKNFDNAKDALSAIKRDDFDMAIIDLMLPDMDGFDLCKMIKEIKDLPIIISSARGDIGNKIMGYEIGVDDFLSKPYEPRELILKIKAILKRVQASAATKVGKLEINGLNRTVTVDGFVTELTKVELEILLYLIKQRGSAVSREQLINATSLDADTKSRVIDMHISNLRYKIGDNPKTPKYIKSVWGIGYRFL